jgi:translocation and assembly module TamB
LFSALDFPGHTLDGDSDVNLGIKGTVAEPQLLGNAVLKNGRYENELTGSTLTDLALTLDAQATSARLTVTGKDGGRGTLNGDMTMDLGRGIGSAAGRLSVTDAMLLKRDDAIARLTGELRVVSAAGVDGALRIEGKMTASDVTARLPKSLPPDVVVVDVIDPAAPPPPVNEGVQPNKSVPIELDLGIDIPGPATVEGRGLKSLWKGNLAVKGLVSAPEISGKLIAMRGGLDLAGQQLELNRGEITFDSGTTIDPQLDIAFAGKSEDIETEIILKGRASTLKVEAKSNPPLPQDEVLALALFGKPSTELSAGEALQLVRSIAQLSGQTGGGYDIVSELQSNLGVDVLRVEGLTGSDGPSVTAGKYVSEDIYLGVRQGAKPGSTKATAEFEITDEITAETDVGQDASSSVGLNWKYDY